MADRRDEARGADLEETAGLRPNRAAGWERNAGFIRQNAADAHCCRLKSAFLRNDAVAEVEGAAPAFFHSTRAGRRGRSNVSFFRSLEKCFHRIDGGMAFGVEVGTFPEISFPGGEQDGRNRNGGEICRARHAEDRCGVAAVGRADEPGRAGVRDGGSRAVQISRGREQDGRSRGGSFGGRDVHGRLRTLIGAEAGLFIDVWQPRFGKAPHGDAVAGREKLSIAQRREAVRVQQRVVQNEEAFFEFLAIGFEDRIVKVVGPASSLRAL